MALVSSLLLLALLDVTGLAADELESVRASHGFAIARPDGTWSLKEQEDAATGAFTLSVLPPGSKGESLVSVRAEFSTDAPVELRDRTLKQVRDRSDYSEVKSATRRLGGRNAPGVRVDVSYQGVLYRARQYWVENDGVLYEVKCHAPRAEFSRLADSFEGVLDTFRFVPVAAEGREAAALKRLASRCGSEIDWLENWDDAAARARRGKRLILVYARFQPGFAISDAGLSGPFMDRDIVGLLNQRFVALRLTKEMETPLRAPSRYGLSPTAFGVSIMAVTPDGEVVRETFTTETTAVYDLLVEALRREPASVAPPVPQQPDPLERAARLLERGDLERAADLLEGADSPDGRLLKARLFRLERRGEDALVEARCAAAGAAEADPARLEEARILIRMGRFEDARAPLVELAERGDAEARYRLGATLLQLGDRGGADRLWRELVREQPDSRWAWKAAAILTSTAFALGVMERIDWPPQELIESVRVPDAGRLGIAKQRVAQQDAVRFLLEHQRQNGSWICPAEVATSAADVQNPLTDAITAICGAALLPEPTAAGAVTRAVSYLVASHARARARGDTQYFMDYTCWRDAYVLWFLADCVAAGRFDREAEVLAQLLDNLACKQKQGGGWSYYVTGDLARADAPANQSISFVTGAVTLALLRAREVGIAVPDRMMNAALDCLERMRNDNGTFTYFLHHDDESAGRRAGRPGAAGRGPLGALALLRGGRGGLAEVKEMLDLFLEHREGLAAEQGKALMHCGPDGQGSHYLLFDYRMAAAAVAALPVSARARYRKPLLDLLLRARTADGAFLDNPLIGRAYGAGIALQAFRDLNVVREF